MTILEGSVKLLASFSGIARGFAIFLFPYFYFTFPHQTVISFEDGHRAASFTHIVRVPGIHLALSFESGSVGILGYLSGGFGFILLFAGGRLL